MSTAPRFSREIDGKGRTVRELLAGCKYSIDYYQREYMWQQKQVAELLDHLANKVLESDEDGNERSAVADHCHYSRGSIIFSDKDGQKFIIDGQQRLTTLNLPYAEKREHYVGQNLLAKSLHERACDHNPGFQRFIDESGLPFRAHAEFRKEDLDARQVLYQRLEERIWSPERLEQEAAS